jgi:2'-5' RNA ligase
MMTAGKPPGWRLPFLPGAIVILPPAEVRRRVDRLRRRYDPVSASLVPAHVTITQPFRSEPGAAELARLETIVSRFPAFTLRFGSLGSFLPYPCIWFKVEPFATIVALRRALHATGLFNTDLRFTRGFVPHMSITDGLPRAEEAERLFCRLAGRVKGGSFRVNELVYTRPDWTFKFLPVAELLLGKARM